MNRTATARRLTLTALTGFLALGSLVGTLAAPAHANGIQLAKASINQTGLQVGGTYAKLSWQSNASTTNVQISTSPPKQSSGKWIFDGSYSADSVPKTDGSFKYTAWDLEPATTYHLILTTKATPALASAQVTGSFTTGTRSFVVKFQQIHVSDDADGVFKGAGDLEWYFDTGLTPWSDPWDRSASSGDTFDVNYLGKGEYTAGALEVTAPSVTLTVQAREYDGIGFCPTGAFTGELEQGWTDCADHAFAQTVWTFPTGLFESTEMTWEASVSGDPALRFSVSGTIQAIYS